MERGGGGGAVRFIQSLLQTTKDRTTKYAIQVLDDYVASMYASFESKQFCNDLRQITHTTASSNVDNEKTFTSMHLHAPKVNLRHFPFLRARRDVGWKSKERRKSEQETTNSTKYIQITHSKDMQFKDRYGKDKGTNSVPETLTVKQCHPFESYHFSSFTTLVCRKEMMMT